MRHIVISLCLALVSFSTTIAVLELFFRFAPPRLLGYQSRPDAIERVREFEPDPTVNAMGFHDVAHDPAQPRGTRVLLLGDSYVEAVSVPVADTVGQQLERGLNRIAGGRYEVIAVGQGDWGQKKELERLQELGPQLRPTVVITLFLSLNDVRDDSDELGRLERENDRNIFRMRPGWTDLPLSEAPWLWFRSSELNRFVSFRLALVEHSGFRLGGGPRGSGIPFDYLVYQQAYDDPWTRAWQEKASDIAKTQAFARRLGALYLVVSASTPQGILGLQEGLALLRREYPAMRRLAWDLDRPDRLLTEICGNLGVPVLLLQPPMRSYARTHRQTLHWPYDGHWNREGNRVAGELMAEFVLGQTRNH